MADQFVAAPEVPSVIAETGRQDAEDDESMPTTLWTKRPSTVTLTPEGVAKAEAYFHMENLLRPGEHHPAPPHQPGHPGPRHYEAGRRLCGQGRPGHHRGRVHRPPDVRPPLQRGPASGHRGQGGRHRRAARSKTLATITFQNYFRMYNKLSGMTGTAMTEEDEFQQHLRAWTSWRSPPTSPWSAWTIPTWCIRPSRQVRRRHRADRGVPRQGPARAGGHHLHRKVRAAVQAC